MCARRISNRLCEEWKLKRASGHQWKQMKYSVVVAHKGKNNTLFGTVKSLFLFVFTHNIKKIYNNLGMCGRVW